MACCQPQPKCQPTPAHRPAPATALPQCHLGCRQRSDADGHPQPMPRIKGARARGEETLGFSFILSASSLLLPPTHSRIEIAARGGDQRRSGAGTAPLAGGRVHRSVGALPSRGATPNTPTSTRAEPGGGVLRHPSGSLEAMRAAAGKALWSQVSLLSRPRFLP